MTTPSLGLMSFFPFCRRQRHLPWRNVFAVPLSLVQRKAMFVDCNAVNVETVRRISSIIEPTGASFVDGSIIGHPPDPQGGPTFYFSGSAAKELAAFEGLGLKVRIMEAPIGAASALKMAYAGINKGITHPSRNGHGTWRSACGRGRRAS